MLFSSQARRHLCSPGGHVPLGPCQWHRAVGHPERCFLSVCPGTWGVVVLSPTHLLLAGLCRALWWQRFSMDTWEEHSSTCKGPEARVSLRCSGDHVTELKQ